MDESGMTTVKSLCGATLSIAMILLLLVFTSYKMIFLIQRNGTQYVETVSRRFYSYKDEFTAAQGLMVAANTAVPLPKEVGSLEFFIDTWDITSKESAANGGDDT